MEVLIHFFTVKIDAINDLCSHFFSEDTVLVHLLVKICRTTGLTLDDFSGAALFLENENIFESANEQLAQKSKKSAKK